MLSQLPVSFVDFVHENIKYIEITIDSPIVNVALLHVPTAFVLSFVIKFKSSNGELSSLYCASKT